MSECTRSSITSLRVSVLALIAAAALGACSAEAPASSDADRTLRIAVAKFQHETCTFCPGGDTEIADWIRVRPPFDDEALFESGDFVRGFTARAREYGNVELLPLRSPEGVFGGSSRSWNSEETFEHFAGMIIEDLRSAMPVDGVYLALHGAMAVRNVPRPEAELARRVREIVGPDVPIAGSFDLHGNEDEEFLRWADFSFVTKRYPHYDAYIQGERSARHDHQYRSGRLLPHNGNAEAGHYYADGRPVDRPVPVDGRHGTRPTLGVARAGRLRERLLWISLVGRTGRRSDGPGDDQ